MNTTSVDMVLSQMRALSQKQVVPTEQPGVDKPDFSHLLQESIGKVNELQKNAASLKTSYEVGDENVDLPEVMIASQKASLSFEAMTQVRNKLLNAYQEVMNMQV